LALKSARIAAIAPTPMKANRTTSEIRFARDRGGNLSPEAGRAPDGNEADWDIFGHERTVATLAFTRSGDVVLARQFRPGPALILNEMPSGAVEDGEGVLDAAARELLEETGFAGRCELAGAAWLGAGSRTRRFAVVVLVAESVAEPRSDPGEFWEVALVPLAEFRDQLRAGELTDTDLGYLALDHLNLL
jgi:ADP-ribose pyrophosphatase